MMQDFRAGLQKHGKWLVVLIAIPFAFFGVETLFFSGSSVEEVARVDGERITRLELDQSVERQRSYLLQRFGDIDPALIDDGLLRGPALDNLVATRALEVRARKQGMGVAPQLIAKVLGDAPLFQIDGSFSRDAYQVYLRQMGYTPQTHSRYLGREIVVSQLTRGLAQSVFILPQELDALLVGLEETRDLAWLEIPIDAMLEGIEVTAADVEAHYAAHPERYTTVEEVVLHYLEFSRAGVAEALEIEEDLLQQRYRERVAEVEAATRPILAQILVRFTADDAAQRKLERIQEALAAGAEFAGLAMTESEDPLSAEFGGEIGPYIAEEFPPALRAAIEPLERDEVSTPVKSDEGWHIFKRVRDEGPTLGAFAEERAALRAELAAQKAEALYGEQLEQLIELAYSSGNLADVARAMDLPLQTSEPLTRAGGPGLGAERRVVDAAFQDEVLDGRISPVIEFDDGRALVLQLQERRPATLRPLEEVSAEIEVTLKAERAAVLALERGEALRAELSAGADLESLAAESGFETQIQGQVGRYDQQLSRELLDEVFGAGGADALPIAGILPQQTRVLVYQITGVHPGVPDEIPDQRKQELARALQGALANRDVSSYQELVVAGAKVRVQPVNADAESL